MVLTSNPLLGETTACAEPDLILSISPIEDAGIFDIPLPSPTKVAYTVEADTNVVTFSEPVICVFAFICNG